MRTFPCSCGNKLFFGNTQCLACGLETGVCPECHGVAPLVGDEPEGLYCGHRDCGIALKKCANYLLERICNRCLRADDESSETRCDYCALTAVIPDQSVAGNHEKWQRLEWAKQRVLDIVDLIGLPFRPSHQPSVPCLAFEFKADGEQPVHTGHQNGTITINLREVDDVEREKTRVAFQEPQRTLVGHFRHELGHYFWDRLVKAKCEEECREVFGDERDPAYVQALEAYHAQGPREEWPETFVTAYASMHPWEDFAETFGTYLDMVSVLDTARHFGVTRCDLYDVDSMIKCYQEVGFLANEFNRDMGLVDLVPEVFVPAVIVKLRFIHTLSRDTPK